MMKRIGLCLVLLALSLPLLGCGGNTPPGGNKDYDRPKEPAKSP